MGMLVTPKMLPNVVTLLYDTILENADELAELDRILGDGDHVVNLLRGLEVLKTKSGDLIAVDWPQAFQVIGMSLMSSVGGASGSLYGTFFLKMGSALKESELTTSRMADIFSQGVDAMKARGKSDVGEKTMLDVLVPVAQCFVRLSAEDAERRALLIAISKVATDGVEATREMVATKGRAAYLGDRTVGHLDAGAKSSQLMLCALTDFLAGDD
jgi:dihydroxyacetone kinase-like protein